MANALKMLKLKPTSIQFIQELPIDAPPEKVWKAVMNFGGWFYFNADQSKRPKVTLEPHIGGRFMSDAKDGSESRLYGIVSHLEPSKLLRINGPMGMSHLPVSNTMIWELQPKKNGKGTLLRFCQRAYGLMTPNASKDYQSGWKQLLPQIKALAEKSKR